MEYIRTSKVIKNGTSLAVVIPKEILKALKWERADQIVFGIYDDDSLLLRKISDFDVWKLKA